MIVDPYNSYSDDPDKTGLASMNVPLQTALILSLLQTVDDNSVPAYIGHQRVVTPATSVRLNVVDPKRTIPRIWASPDGRSFGDKKYSPNDIEKLQYNLCFYFVCEDIRGRLFSPVWWSTLVEPHPIAPGAITFRAFCGVDNHLHIIGPDTTVTVPHSNDIRQTFVVFWLLDREGISAQELRVHSIRFENGTNVYKDELAIPPIDELPRLADHPRHNGIVEVHAQAKEEADAMLEYDRRIRRDLYDAIGLREILARPSGSATPEP